MAKQKNTPPASALQRFDRMQSQRYSLVGAKDGDGDPAYARDVLSIQRNGANKMSSLLLEGDKMRYRHSNGD